MNLKDPRLFPNVRAWAAMLLLHIPQCHHDRVHLVVVCDSVEALLVVGQYNAPMRDMRFLGRDVWAVITSPEVLTWVTSLWPTRFNGTSERRHRVLARVRNACALRCLVCNITELG